MRKERQLVVSLLAWNLPAGISLDSSFHTGILDVAFVKIQWVHLYGFNKEEYN